MTKILDSDDSSDDELLRNSTKKSHSSDQTSAWKIDRLKTSLQKPGSEPHDKQSATEPGVKKQSKDIQRKVVPNEERLKELARKEDVRRDKEKGDKRPGAVEAVSKGSEIRTEDRPRKDSSEKYSKSNVQSGSKQSEKGNRNDAKQRPSFVIPKLKKPAETAPKSTTPLADTWSDMLRRGAELEKNRPKQTTPGSAGMRRIPKVVPKDSLCGKADVGVLDKIEQHPGFLRWQQATSQKHAPKTDDRTNSAAAKSSDRAVSKHQSSTDLGQKIPSLVDSKHLRHPGLSGLLHTQQASSEKHSPMTEDEKDSTATKTSDSDSTNPNRLFSTGTEQPIPSLLDLNPTQHPEFPRWLLAASPRDSPKTEDKKNSAAVKSTDDTNRRQQSIADLEQQIRSLIESKALQSLITNPRQQSSGLEQQILSVLDKKPLQQLVSSVSSLLQSPTVTSTPSSSFPPTPVKALLPTPEPVTTPSSLPASARKKVLLPTPDRPMAAAPIPVLVRRGASSQSRGQFNSSPSNDDDDLMLDETDAHPG